MPRIGKNRERLLSAGIELFSTQGFSATGVQEIADAAGVPKGSFYNYFGSKEDFAVTVLDTYQQQACDQIGTMLRTATGSPLERLASIFEDWRRDMVEANFAGGCLAGRLCQELAGENVALRAPLDRAFYCMGSFFADVLRQAQEVGELGPDEDPDELAGFIQTAWQGAAAGAKASGSDQPLRRFQRVVFGRLLPALGDAV